ncbi:hypothetical protein NDU88_002425 [Pleurodeles waltl]|uniref:Uncharacterized protein n=1 Tax=Pleurodeles waltl TaxID=8319 RepID=A0AAV7RBX9_PLEWA|nr:hypothetical protein NDU88_002425 [Pleurodeles waltl]
MQVLAIRSLMHHKAISVGSSLNGLQGSLVQEQSRDVAGKAAMWCAQLMPELVCALEHMGKLDAVVVHLRDNDLAELGRKDLLKTLVPGVTAMSKLLRPADVVWSEIIAKSHWRRHTTNGHWRDPDEN